MTGRRRALVVAIDEYENPGLRALRSPAADAEALAAVLGDSRIGDFEVDVVRNEPAHEVQARIEDLFAEARADDVLLLHFSGHGLKGEAGDLFFAARNTRPDRLASTAVPADFVQRCIRSTASRSVVLLLDCCYGGAFGQGVAVRAAGDVNVLDNFPTGRLGGGRGRAVITASNAMEYAFEGEQLATDDHPRPSIFTSALVQGLTTGDADRDEDGWVSLDELYDYVFDAVRAKNPHQTPTRDIEMQGDFLVARSRRRRVVPAPVPPDLRAALEDANPYARLGAVAELKSRLLSENLPVASSAHEALTAVAAADTRLVADAAAQALDALTLVVTPDRLDFGGLPVGVTSQPRRIAVGGPPLARATPVIASDPWIRIADTDGGYDVSVTPPGAGASSGSLTWQAPREEVRVLIVVEGVPAAAAAPASAPKPAAPVVTAPVVTASVASASGQPVQHVPEAPERPRRLPTAIAGWLAAIGAAVTLVAAAGAQLSGRWPLLQALAQGAGGWVLITVLAPVGVALVGGILVVLRRRPLELGRGLVLAGAAAATWLPVFLITVSSKDGDLNKGRAPVIGLVGVVLIVAAGVLTATTDDVWASPPRGGRVGILLVASAVVGALALLLDVLQLAAAQVGSTSVDVLLPASWWFVVPALLVPLSGLAISRRPLRAALLAGWAVAAGGVWATSFGIQVGAGAGKTYAWLDLYGFTLLALLVTAFVGWPERPEAASA
jgi:Caspase domain